MTIFDQSAQGNHIATAPPGGAARKSDLGVNATKEMLTVGGKPVYAAVFEGGMGYRRETTTGIATGDDPESMYAPPPHTHTHTRTHKYKHKHTPPATTHIPVS